MTPLLLLLLLRLGDEIASLCVRQGVVVVVVFFITALNEIFANDFYYSLKILVEHTHNGSLLIEVGSLVLLVN